MTEPSAFADWLVWLGIGRILFSKIEVALKFGKLPVNHLRKAPGKRYFSVDCYTALKMSAQKRPKKATPRKSLIVDRQRFEGIVKRLIHADPLKREDVKPDKKKPGKLIEPQADS